MRTHGPSGGRATVVSPARSMNPYGMAVTLTLWLLAQFLWPLPAPTVEVVAPPDPNQPVQTDRADLEVFVREGCPHCSRAKAFLDRLLIQHPRLRLLYRDVAADPAHLERLTRLATERGQHPIGVPAFLIGDTLLVGYHDEATTGAEIRRLLDERERAGPIDGIQGVATSWFGPLDVRTMGLPLFTIAMGLLDGFNPCAMWVLLFLLSLLVQVNRRRTMAVIAGTFVLVSGGVYFAFMAAWLNLFLLIGLARPTELVLGWVAVLMGSIHVKDFFAFGRGPSLSIPASAKPGLYERMRRVVQAEDLGGAVAAVVVLAVLVNIVELLCTAGFPAVYTRILTMQALPAWQYYGYLALYNLAYIADDSLMTILAIVTLNRRKLQEREGRWLKLISGLVMTGLGVTLILRPDWLR